MSQSSENFDEITPLEYARQNDIAVDHLAFQSPSEHVLNLQMTADKDLFDDPALLPFAFGHEFNLEEQLELSTDADQMMYASTRADLQDDTWSILEQLLKPRCGKSFKLELPLLATDHELDCKRFLQKEGFEINLEDIRLPLEQVDEEQYEGVNFPSRYWDLNAKFTQETRLEKLAVTKHAIAFLQETIKPAWTDTESKNVWKSLQTYKRTKRLEAVTPPLSPSLSPVKPYEPEYSSSAFEVPILSDPASLVKQDIEAIEQKIFKDDCPTPLKIDMIMPDTMSPATFQSDGTVKPRDIFTPNSWSSPSAPLTRHKREPFKVEVPLVSPIARTVKFSDPLDHFDLQPVSEPAPLEDVFFTDAFNNSELAMQRIKQERLSTADAMSRVEVPILDLSWPESPWQKFAASQSASSALSSQQAFIEGHMNEMPNPWPDPNQPRNKIYRWHPFSTDLAKTALEEVFDKDDSAWEPFVIDLNNSEVVGSSALTWKRPGLRILTEDDDDDDDDEIGFATFTESEPPTLGSLVKKRKLDLDEKRDVKEKLLEPPSNRSLDNSNPLGFLTHQNGASNQKAPAKQKVGSLLDGDFSAGNEINKLLEMRGIKRLKVEPESSNTITPQVQSFQVKPVNQQLLQLPVRKSPLARQAPLPFPVVNVPTVPIHVIMSTAMFRRREIVKALEKTMPTLTLIERDFSAHNSTSWLPGSVSRSPVTSPLAAEADFIISPTVGVIITTMQKIKQKPLPGQKAKPEIQSRLEKVSLRYERLIVLVSTSETTTALARDDCLAFSEFVGLASGLDANIIVNIIDSGDEALSKWLLSLIASHHVPEGLLAEETHWEIFLRRAGMNVFAAQSVITLLSAPEGVDKSSPSKAGMFGLSKFVEMGRCERMVMLKHVCGEKLLTRVSDVIDQKWDIS